MASPAFSDIMITETSSPKSPPDQDFSIFDNLSPIKHVKAAHIGPDFPGINLREFPELSFALESTLPFESSHHEKSSLKRAELLQNDGNPVASAITSSADSTNSYVSEATNVAEISGRSIDSRRAIEFDDENDKGKDEGIEGKPPLVLSKKDEEDPQGDPIHIHEPVKKEEPQRVQQPVDEQKNMDCTFPPDNDFRGQQREDLHTQACENHSGIHKRCLQFDEAPLNFPKRSDSSLDPTAKGKNSESPFTAAESEGLESLANFNAASSEGANCKLFQSSTTLFPQRRENFPSRPPTTSCSAMHLNGISSNLQAQHDHIANSIPVEVQMGLKKMKLSPDPSCHSPKNLTSCSNSSNATYRVSFVAEDGRDKSKSPVPTSSAPFESPNHNEALNLSKPNVHHASQHDKNTFCSKQVESYECSQLTSNKTRANTLSTSDSDGRNRCNCRKRACKQLYCDCFAAGKNCTEACGCQGCLNRPENKDTIDKARLEILSRNSSAFTPNIVRDSPESNNVEDRKQATTSSRRHIRGCNCKKSMCENRYCECFKNNVGCSSGCRCIGCRNTHGKKEGLDHAFREFVSTKHSGKEQAVNDKAREKRTEGTCNEKLKMVATSKVYPHAQLYDSQHLTPLTPSLEFSERFDRDFQQLSTRDLQSSNSILSPGADSTKVPRTSSSSIMLQETRNFNRPVEHNSAHIMGQFSPSTYEATSLDCPTPQSHPSSVASTRHLQSYISMLSLGVDLPNRPRTSNNSDMLQETRNFNWPVEHSSAQIMEQLSPNNYAATSMNYPSPHLHPSLVASARHLQSSLSMPSFGADSPIISRTSSSNDMLQETRNFNRMAMVSSTSSETRDMMTMSPVQTFSGTDHIAFGDSRRSYPSTGYTELNQINQRAPP